MHLMQSLTLGDYHFERRDLSVRQLRLWGLPDWVACRLNEIQSG